MNNGDNRNRSGRQLPRQGQAPMQNGEYAQRRGGATDPRVRQNQQYNQYGDPVVRQKTGQSGRQTPTQEQRVSRGQTPVRGQRMNPQMQAQGQNRYSGQRPSQSRPASSTRRKATREQMREDKRRRRREAGRLFLGRLAVYGVMLVIIAALCAGVFFWMFYSTPDANESKITFFECYDGGTTVKNEVSGDSAYKNGRLYLNFSNIAEGCGMTVIIDSKNAKFVLPDGGDTSDSAGTGHEEYVSFTNEATECSICGQESRLSAPAVFDGKQVWVPADFVTGYVNGITVTEEKDDGVVYVVRDEDENEVLAEVSFKLKATTAPETAEPTGDLTVGGDMPEVTFSTDLSDYEQYMNPADNSEFLILVNKTNTIDETYAPDDLTNVTDTRNDGRETQQMRKYAAKALEAMFIEMRAAGYTDVSVTSAYRSYEYQDQLYNTYTEREMSNNPSLTKEQAQAIVSTYSAKPGTSEHQTGLCCDLHNLSSASVEFKNEAAYGWLTDNAWKFGFILRFPEDKTEETGYSFEPWHYRYVGRSAAWQITNAGMCLEDYLDANAD